MLARRLERSRISGDGAGRNGDCIPLKVNIQESINIKKKKKKKVLKKLKTKLRAPVEEVVVVVVVFMFGLGPAHLTVAV